jgi:hypothetical protein
MQELLASALEGAWNSDSFSLKEILEINTTRLTPEQSHDLALCFADAGKRILALSDRAGQAFLSLLWEADCRALHLFAGQNGAEYNTLTDWATSCIHYHDPEYVRSMARVVERIFHGIVQDIFVVTPDGAIHNRDSWAESHDGELITTRELLSVGERLTPEKLIDTPKILARLKEGSFQFLNSTPAQKAKVLTAIVKPRSKATTSALLLAASEARLFVPRIERKGEEITLTLSGLSATDLDMALALLRPMLSQEV